MVAVDRKEADCPAERGWGWGLPTTRFIVLFFSLCRELSERCHVAEVSLLEVSDTAPGFEGDDPNTAVLLLFKGKKEVGDKALFFSFAIG